MEKLSLKSLNIHAVGAYIVEGAKLGALTFGGRVVTGYATALVDLIPGLGNSTAAVEIGLQLVSSVVIGVLGAMVSPVIGLGLMAGGFEGALDNFVQTYIPSVSTALQLSSGGASAPAAATSGYARTRRVGAYARRLRGIPLNPAIPQAQKRGMASYAGGGGRTNNSNENV